MPEEVLFETELRRSRAEVADYLRAVADKLDADEPVTLTSGDESVTMDPPASVDFEVKAERETSAGGGNEELSIELELEWSDADRPDELDVS
ncbi:amphi-Trp domain-containing protein [Halobacterium yunchengense]|uniref:amphi-Trp domain-containing protein n=1 Tax=Halobacterium yunchengense TaxID=3108497 RepID=UPI00300B194F